MSYLPLQALATGFNYDSMSVPVSPSIGQTWRERDSNNLVVEQWFWNGANWLSLNTIPRDTLLISGQSITLTNILVGLVTSTTDEIPFSINSTYGIYITKMYAALRIPSGNLSATNYWKLLLKNGSTTLQTIDVTAGDDGATTGDVRKSVSVGASYPKTGKYSLSLVQQGAPPGARSPSALIECRLVR
ncbi:MAG: hypothetical protein RMY28_009405 [Nostoc sp. ChiSLP01]|nr:hypothetical protein [Nostoc sp. CmiSLP01]MDZ8285229.1 hypothetical protein [Nostoc sp. ChiSLP01]